MATKVKTDSALEARIAAGKFAVTAEIGPPKSADAQVVRRKAAELAGLVDGANVTDNQTATVRMSSIAGAVIAREAGIDPIIQVTCRDRNRIGIQSDVLGAAGLGLHNVLCMTGDPAKVGNHPDAKDVFDLNTGQLISMFRDMRDQKRFLNGEEMRVPPRFFIGGTASPMGATAEREWGRLAEKIAAGVDFVQSQFVYDPADFRAFMARFVGEGLAEHTAFLAGVGPLRSLSQAQHMSGIPGVVIPEQVMQRLAGAGDPQREGMDICLEVIAELRHIPGVSGVHIMAVGQEDVVPDLIKAAKLRDE